MGELPRSLVPSQRSLTTCTCHTGRLTSTVQLQHFIGDNVCRVQSHPTRPAPPPLLSPGGGVGRMRTGMGRGTRKGPASCQSY